MIFSSDCHETISKVENHENIQTYTATAIFMTERFNFHELSETISKVENHENNKTYTVAAIFMRDFIFMRDLIFMSTLTLTKVMFLSEIQRPQRPLKVCLPFIDPFCSNLVCR